LRKQVSVRNEAGKRVRHRAVREALTALLAGRGPVELLLTDDAGMRRLNRQARGVDRTTDVLSWPGPDFPGAPLGEIAVNVDEARRATADLSRPSGWRLEVELAFLAVHGALHLLGWEDDTEAGRRAMVAEANRVLGGLGLPTDDAWESLPYAEVS
jgi:probable rRNA maturation factor